MSNRTLQLLMISLALNVFFIGGVAGAAIMWQRAEVEGHLPAARRSDRMLQAAGALSPEYRLLLRQSVQEAARSLRPHFEEARAARLEVARSLVQSTLDPAALEAALARGRAAGLTIRAGLEKAVIDAAVRLPPVEREAFAEELRRVGAIRPARRP